MQGSMMREHSFYSISNSVGQRLGMQEDDQIAEKGWQYWRAELGNHGGGSRAYRLMSWKKWTSMTHS